MIQNLAAIFTTERLGLILFILSFWTLLYAVSCRRAQKNGTPEPDFSIKAMAPWLVFAAVSALTHYFQK